MVATFTTKETKDGTEIDNFTTLEEAKHIARGVGLGLLICGNKVSIKL